MQQHLLVLYGNKSLTLLNELLKLLSPSFNISSDSEKTFLTKKNIQIAFFQKIDSQKSFTTFVENFKLSHINIVACEDTQEKNYFLLQDFIIQNYKTLTAIQIQSSYNNEYNIFHRYKLKEVYMLIEELLELNALHIYSMLSDEETYNLYSLSKMLSLEKNDVIIEYGVFLGGSLEAILLGLKQNKEYKQHHIYALDLFEVSKVDGFYNYVKQIFSNNPNLKQYIKKNKIVWKDYIYKELSHQQNNLHVVQGEVDALKLNSNNHIALLHLDLAKKFLDLKKIFSNISSNIDRKSMIIHQDFFYHFSPEVIAFLFQMIQEKKVDIDFLSSFSTIYLNNWIVTEEDFHSFNLSCENITLLIKETIEYMNSDINLWQKASLYGAIIYYLKIHNKKYHIYIDQLRDIKQLDIRTQTHIDRMLQELEKR